LKSFNYIPYLFSKKVEKTALYRDNFFIVCGLWRPQMQGGKNWILPKEIDANRPVPLRLSLARNLE
jgi:hypothetical protein